MMLRIAVCDDSTEELEQAKTCIQEYGQNRQEWDISVSTFATSISLLDGIEARGQFDIYVLNLVMPMMNGIELGAEIRRHDNAARIILLSDSNEYAAESYSIRAKDYIRKPWTKERLFESLNKILDEMLEERNHNFVFHVPGGVYVAPYSRIQFVEYYNHRVNIHLKDGEEVQSSTLRQSFHQFIEPLLQEGRFVQVSASCVINMQHVQKLTGKEFELIGGKIFPLSRLYSKARNIYIDYIMDNN